jgi:trans-2-enoyl-CoA reductase
LARGHLADGPGKRHAPIHATYDVSEIKEAVAAAASGGRSGKILILPRH